MLIKFKIQIDAGFLLVLEGLSICRYNRNNENENQSLASAD